MAGLVVWDAESVREILLRHGPSPAGDEPLAFCSIRWRFISLPRLSWIPACAGTPKYEKNQGAGRPVFIYGGSELGSANDPPAAGDKPQPYNVLFRLEMKSQLEEVS